MVYTVAKERLLNYLKKLLLIYGDTHGVHRRDGCKNDGQERDGVASFRGQHVTYEYSFLTQQKFYKTEKQIMMHLPNFATMMLATIRPAPMNWRMVTSLLRTNL